MGWWDLFVETFVSELTDISDLEEAYRVCIRLVLAALFGGLLGYEREYRGKAAGLRTHMLVCLGAALFVLVPMQADLAPSDSTRVIQGIVTGIGFLGAGTILKGNHIREVYGLTTAAGIWMTAAIGIAVGFGHIATAAVATTLALTVLTAMPLLERDAAKRARRQRRQKAAASPSTTASGPDTDKPSGDTRTP